MRELIGDELYFFQKKRSKINRFYIYLSKGICICIFQDTLYIATKAYINFSCGKFQAELRLQLGKESNTYYT